MKRCLAIAIAVLGIVAPAAAAATYTLPPTGQDQWYWEISPSSNGLAGLPSVTGAYPWPGSANIWDTDMFADSNTDGGVPTGPSPVVQALHAAGKYSICYIEAGAQQAEPDSSNFAPADYTNGSNAQTTEMQGWPGEYWYDIRGFANYVAGDPSTLTGAAVNIAAGLTQRIDDCAVEGQDAVEPDDLDGYTNPSQTGAPGGGWGLTQADSAGFERWLAYAAHSDGLAIFQKNDPANASVDEPLFDGMIIEECNAYDDPCAGSGGDATRTWPRASPCSTPNTRKTARRPRSSARGIRQPASSVHCSTSIWTGIHTRHVRPSARPPAAGPVSEAARQPATAARQPATAARHGGRQRHDGRQ